MEIPVIRNVLEANEKLSARLKEHFARHGILTLNLISSPGAGKTSLLERTLADLSPEFRMAVIEGDLQTDNDAQRVAATGAQAVQINTEGGCHLDSNLVMEALGALDLSESISCSLKTWEILSALWSSIVARMPRSPSSASPKATISPKSTRSSSTVPVP